MTKRKILCVHKDIELYGSDRMFLRSVCAFRQAYPRAHITVVLPFDGPLVALLRPYLDELIFSDMFILRRAEFGLKTIIQLPAFHRLVRQARKLIAEHDLVYISTILIMCYSVAARMVDTPRFVHIHEMPQGIEAKVFARFLQGCRLHGIAISQAVADSMYKRGDSRVSVVHNGMTPPDQSDRAWDRSDKLKLLMLGRYLSWKGQPLLVRALASLSPEEQAKIEVRFVGSAFRGQEFHLHDLKKLCQTEDLKCTYSFHDFTTTAGDAYTWCDIVMVPSTNPEPFGLIAIEGMAYGKPVIGAGHGGLAEIVQPGQTGLLFAPNSITSLASAIRSYLQNPSQIDIHGTNGKALFSTYYTHEAFEARLIQAIETQST